MRKGAEQIDIAPAAGGLSVKYSVDGVSYAGTAIDAGVAGAVFNFLKGLAGLDIKEHRKPQSGSIKLAVDGKKKKPSSRPPAARPASTCGS